MKKLMKLILTLIWEVFDEYERITKEATNGDDWVEKLCEFAKTYQVAVTEDEHIKKNKRTYR